MWSAQCSFSLIVNPRYFTEGTCFIILEGWDYRWVLVSDTEKFTFIKVEKKLPVFGLFNKVVNVFL